jgi:acetyl-CoA C-acetyltransferase
VWSSQPGGGSPAESIQAEVEAAQPRRHLLTTYAGPATVCAYTVAHGRDGAREQGLLVLDTEDGRALARVRDADLMADAESRELVGQPVTVTTDGKRNEARW